MSLSVHNHTHLDDDEVVERFSVRWREYQELVGHLSDASPPRHVLIIARRGMGKSLLVRRLAIAAVREPHRAGTWLPVLLPEELYSVLSIGELWLAVLEAMATQLGDDDLRRAADVIRAESDPVRLATLALGRIVGTAEQRNVRLLLLVENLDMLFNEQLTEDDGWALRKTLQNEASILLIGTAIAPFAQIESHGSALFEFFRIIHLDGLDGAETAALWNHVTGVPLPEGQAEPVRLLTGGNPRMITILAAFATRPDLSGLLEDLEMLVDEYTPYFKANIEQLPPVERKIFVTLADLWAPSTAAEVGARARMDSSKVSALLGRMTKRGLVTTVDPAAVPRRYELTERLFQLYHLLRNVDQAGRVHALFDIIRHLFLPQELHRRIMPLLVEQLGGSPSRVLVASALERHLDELTDEVFQSTQDHAGRLTWLQRLLKEQERTLGNLAQESLASRAEIAYCLGELGRGEEALALYERVVADSERVLGGDHPTTLVSRHGVAFYLGELGRGEEALALYERVAADRERVLGGDHPDTLSARHSVAFYLGKLGRREEALALGERVAADAERVLGGDHQTTLVSRSGVAYYLGELGRREEALALGERVAADAERVLGGDHPDTLRTRHSVAFYLGELGRREEALALFERVAADAERVLGGDHPDTLSARHQVAFYLGQLGRREEALALFERVAADRERVLGGDHPDTLRTRHQVAFYLVELGRREEALALYERVAADAERVLGREDAISRSARGGAALMRLRLQDDQPMPRELREILRRVPAGPPGASSGAGDERSARAAGADPTDHRASSLDSSEER